jgi:hypothetical protein
VISQVWRVVFGCAGYRDLLLARMSPNSVQRNLGVVKAAINHVLLEHDLDFRNVFQAIKIKGAGSSNTDRLPITDEQLVQITPAFASSDVASSLLLLLTDTGAKRRGPRQGHPAHPPQ